MASAKVLSKDSSKEIFQEDDLKSSRVSWKKIAMLILKMSKWMIEMQTRATIQFPFYKITVINPLFGH
jgi:hypothetical protein